MQLGSLPEGPEGFGWEVAPTTLFKKKKGRGSFQLTQSMRHRTGLKDFIIKKKKKCEYIYLEEEMFV